LIIRGPKKIAPREDLIVEGIDFSKIDAFLARTFVVISEHKRSVMIFAFAAIFISFFGIKKLNIDNVFMEYFDTDVSVVKSDSFIREKFGGSKLLNIVVSSEEEGRVVSSEVLKVCDELSLYLTKEVKDVGKVTSLVELIKRERVITRKIFTENEREILFNLDNRICKVLCVLIYTGLRIEEFLSLRREDIENNFIFLKQSKTLAGVRAIPIHNKIRNIVDSFLSENMKFLFTWKGMNKKANYDTFRMNFKKVMEELRMEHTIHDTRHTFASMLNKAGANDVVISNLAGHEDKEFTKKIYTHTELEELEEAIKLLQ